MSAVSKDFTQQLNQPLTELKNDFFSRDSVLVAKELVGKIIEINKIKMRILEVEAYKEDRASHARKRTKRSAIMFDTCAHIYVYFIYGKYYCLNITTDKKPGAVLIRATNYPNCNGPGKLCKEFNITTKDNGVALGNKFKIFNDNIKYKIIKSARIGIKKDKELKWRFTLGTIIKHKQ